MAVTSSGQLKLKDDILDEKQNSSTARTNVSLRGLVLNGTNDYQGVDISTNTNSGANPPETGNTTNHQMSEFYSYDHDFNPANFTWGATNTNIGTGAFVASKTDTDANLASMITRANVTFGSSSMTLVFQDVAISGNSTASGMSNNASTVTVSYSDISDVSALAVRWQLEDAYIQKSSSSSTNISALYKTNGHNVTLANDTNFQGIATGSGSTTANNQDFTGTYITCTPSALGGSFSNTQSYGILVQAFNNGQTANLKLTGAGDEIRLQFRVTKNDGSGTTTTVRRQYTSSSSPSIMAISFEMGGFTCLHPDMEVIRYIDEDLAEPVKVSALQVDDLIQTREQANNKLSKDKWTKVNEVRSHTRSGYYIVNDHLKITDDHPIWCVDRFVRVQDMGQGVKKEYVDQEQEVYYIGTDDGHYYVHCDVKYLVSGNYGPATE